MHSLVLLKKVCTSLGLQSCSQATCSFPLLTNSNRFKDEGIGLIKIKVKNNIGVQPCCSTM